MHFPYRALRCHYVYARWICAFMKWLLQLCFFHCFPAGFKLHIPIFINGERGKEENVYIKWRERKRTNIYIYIKDLIENALFFCTVILERSIGALLNDLVLHRELTDDFMKFNLRCYCNIILFHFIPHFSVPFLLFLLWRPEKL